MTRWTVQSNPIEAIRSEAGTTARCRLELGELSVAFLERGQRSGVGRKPEPQPVRSFQDVDLVRQAQSPAGFVAGV